MATEHQRRVFNFNLGVHVCLQCTIIIVTVLLNHTCTVLSDAPEWLDPSHSHGKRIHLRNIGTDPSSAADRSDPSSSDTDDEGYLTDTRQKAVNPGDMGGVVIQQASQDLSARLRWLSNDEIGITNMQVKD